MAKVVSVHGHNTRLPRLTDGFLKGIVGRIIGTFTILLLLLINAIFIAAPTSLLCIMVSRGVSLALVVTTVFVCCVLTALLPISGVVKHLCPCFNTLLLVDTLNMNVNLITANTSVPRVSLRGFRPTGTPVFPLLFFAVAYKTLSNFRTARAPVVSHAARGRGRKHGVFCNVVVTRNIVTVV